MRAWTIAAVAALGLGGCGTYVPTIQEAGNDPELLVHAIVDSIQCEVRNAVSTVIANDKDSAARNVDHARSAAFLDNWSAQVLLMLQIDEKTTVNPTFGGTFPASLFTLGFFANGSSDATRIDKLGYFYTVRDLVAMGPCKGPTKQEHPAGSLLIQSDLKTTEWLSSAVLNVRTDAISTPTTLSHDVKFEIDSSGGITPGWKLVPLSINQTGTFLAISRNRIHELTVTFGPPDPAKPQQLAPTAQSLHDANVIGASITNALRSGVLR